MCLVWIDFEREVYLIRKNATRTAWSEKTKKFINLETHSNNTSYIGWKRRSGTWVFQAYQKPSASKNDKYAMWLYYAFRWFITCQYSWWFEKVTLHNDIHDTHTSKHAPEQQQTPSRISLKPEIYNRTNESQFGLVSRINAIYWIFWTNYRN